VEEKKEEEEEQEEEQETPLLQEKPDPKELEQNFGVLGIRDNVISLGNRKFHSSPDEARAAWVEIVRHVKDDKGKTPIIDVETFELDKESTQNKNELVRKIKKSIRRDKSFDNENKRFKLDDKHHLDMRDRILTKTKSSSGSQNVDVLRELKELREKIDNFISKGGNEPAIQPTQAVKVFVGKTQENPKMLVDKERIAALKKRLQLI